MPTPIASKQFKDSLAATFTQNNYPHQSGLQTGRHPVPVAQAFLLSDLVVSAEIESALVCLEASSQTQLPTRSTTNHKLTSSENNQTTAIMN